MKRAFLLNCFVTMILLASGFTVLALETSPSAETVDEVLIENQEPLTPETEIQLLENDNKEYDIFELASMGIGSIKTIDIRDPDNMGADIYDLSWLNTRPIMSLSDSPIDESDAMDNPFYAYDGDEITNNVTSTISGTSITFDDEDFYQINLTSDGVNSTVDKLEFIISSPEAEENNASILINVLQPNFLLGQWQDAGVHTVGKFVGNKTKIVVVPEGDASFNIEIPIMFQIQSWNSTKLNYSFEVDISSTTRTEWNGFLGAPPSYNVTNRPANMQSVNRSHDMFDWFDFSDAISDTGLDPMRGDQVRFGLSIDIATEERGHMWNPYGLYGTQSPTSSLVFIYLVWFNYTAQQLNVYNTGGNLPYASMLFGRDPVPVIFQAQASDVWLGLAPLGVWGDSQGYYMGGGGNAEVFFNITSVSSQLIPPNNAPVLSQQIDDQQFDEDTGPWNITDLLTHFSDSDTITPLEFVVTKPGGVNNPDELDVFIVDGRYLWANATQANWHGEGEYRIRCHDWGVENRAISVDDREITSNTFEIKVSSVNDPAYIEKVGTLGGDMPNNHEPIPIIITQGNQMFRSKKVDGKDYDEEDEDRLVYTHNATTTAFSMNKKGQIDFIPTNDDVGNTLIRIWVDDQKGDDEDDWVDLLFKVTNSNDAPSLTRIEWSDGARSYDLTMGEDTPTFKNVREDVELNLTVTASDPDIEIGQLDLLTWHVDANGWDAYPHPTDPLKAYVTYTPTNQDAITSIVETNLYCMDVGLKRSQDPMTIRLMIENANDKPEIKTVNNEVPELQGGIKTVSLTQETGIYALEDELFTIQVTAEDIDPRDSVEFEILNTAFQKFADPFDPFTMNFTIRPTQDMIGFHTVMIKVTDDDDETDTVSVIFEVVNTNDPPGDFELDWETSVSLIEGNNITFFVEDLTDPDEDELTVTWNFGDNTAEVVGETVVHSFANDQSYIITVTVSDPSGAKVTETRTITIYPYEEPDPDPNQDSDGDGMPDVYEDENGLNKNVDDSTFDNDKDKYTNIEEYLAGTNPLDPNSKPIETDSNEGDTPWLLIIIIVIVVIGILAAILFFVFALSRKPKQVVQQYAYAPEGPGLPGAQQQQLPAQAAPGLPPAPVTSGIVGEGQQPGLPPAEAPPEEENLMESFLEDAAKQIEAEQAPSEGEENVWRPPAESEPAQESQVDDLFADPPEEPSVEEPVEEPTEAAEPPKEPTKLAGPPPPPMP